MRCAYCQSVGGTMHLDHVVPRSRGGPDDPINIVSACQSCNLTKGDQLPSEWLTVVPYSIARIEQRVSAMVASRTGARRRGRVTTVDPPRIACDACCRDAFPSLTGMHVAWWSRRERPSSGHRTPVLAFEILCTGADRCLIRKDEAMQARGPDVFLSDLPLKSFFGRWAWLELQSMIEHHVWTNDQTAKLISTMRRLSKITPAFEPPTIYEGEGDPTMVDD